MDGNLKNAQEFQAIQIKTEYCGSFTQDNDMAILEIISELLVAELKNIFKSLEANVKNGTKVSLFVSKLFSPPWSNSCLRYWVFKTLQNLVMNDSG